MTKSNNSKRRPELPTIVVTTDEARRLSALGNANMTLFPRVTREMGHARVVADDSRVPGTIRMGSEVRYCDDENGKIRDAAYGVSARSRRAA
jgi:regulator of nucleoside diphosphate kinase